MIVDLLLKQHFQGLSQSTHLPHLPQPWQEPNASVHQLSTTEWNWLDSPAEDVVLVAPLHVQLYIPLVGCSTVSQELHLQKVASARSVPDFSLGGQARALAHIAHSLPVHVTRHLAAWTNSDIGNFETRFDDCDRSPDGWKLLTEQAHSSP